jgi:protein-disulfide isomerase
MEPQSSSLASKLAVPIAIVLAGGLIAGALFITRAPGVGSGSGGEEAGTTATEDIEVRPLSDDDHFLGSPKAQMVLVEFSDTECPFCKQFHLTMHRLIDTFGRDGTLAWVYRHFPIQELHSKARKEAEATECAAELGGNDVFWKYIDRVYEVTPSNNGLDSSRLPVIAQEVGLDRAQFEACFKSGRHAEKVEAHYQEAVTALGRGTPHNILISGTPFGTETIALLDNAALQLPPNTLIVSPDKTKLVMTGALPYDFIKLVIESVKKESEN